MAKLYVFGIGGTGSRVLRALAMLLAAGVETDKSIDTIVPIMVDPDASNGDLNRTADILKKYQEVKKPFENEDCGFFNTKIKTLSQLTGESAGNTSDNFKFRINGTHNKKFKEYIEYNNLDAKNKAFVDLLFSDHNLNSDMDVGFKGNPNIGSVVLNQFTNGNEFKQFTESFGQDDKIFIISSIFGGTGASGFPLLLKNLRELEDANAEFAPYVRNSVIGAISYLPYFKLKSAEKEQSEINSSSFLGKSKAALSYYEHSIVGNNSINSFYYLGDHEGAIYDNHDGRELQKNYAHFLELVGAFSIIDFIKDAPKLSSSHGKAVDPVYKEFGIEQFDNSINFKSFGTKTYQSISKPLAQFALFSKFIHHGLPKALAVKTQWLQEKLNGIPPTFFNDYYYTNYLHSFIKYFDEWIAELEKNSPSFKPFRSNIAYDNAFELIEGFSPNKSFFRSPNMKVLESNASKMIDDHSLSGLNTEAKFIKLFYKVTSTALKEKVRNF